MLSAQKMITVKLTLPVTSQNQTSRCVLVKRARHLDTSQICQRVTDCYSLYESATVGSVIPRPLVLLGVTD